MSNFLGKLVTADMYGITPEALDDMDYLQQIVEEAIERSGMTLVDIQSKEFDPIGITITAILSESHLAIHTYPEYGYIAVDCFTCGSDGNPAMAIEYIANCLMPSNIEVTEKHRGRILH